MEARWLWRWTQARNACLADFDLAQMSESQEYIRYYQGTLLVFNAVGCSKPNDYDKFWYSPKATAVTVFKVHVHGRTITLLVQGL